MLSKHVTSIIACPDCKGNIKEITAGDAISALFCETCELVYPAKESILIMLPKYARNYTLEYNLVENINRKIANPLNKLLDRYIDNTLKLLDSLKGTKTWEWEDEEFWNEEYKKERISKAQKNWNDRIWQRKFFVESVLQDMGQKEKTILDCGSGEGQDFRLSLSQYCDEQTLYIATDISFEGLKLNQERNRHKNSIYILCTIDNLPIQKESLDVLCYFGILHHTEKKELSIPDNSKLLKKGGFILLHEALERPSL